MQSDSYSGLVARMLIAWLLIAAIGFVAANAWGRTPLSVLRALESLPVWKHDRGPEHQQLKDEQRQRVAAAVLAVARDADEAAMLLTIGHHESAWSLAIENGVCGPKQCDRDRKGRVRAHSNYQLHLSAVSSREAWEAARTDVLVATQEAAFALRRARGMCHSTGEGVRGVLRGYAGLGCRKRLRDEEARVRTFERVRARL
jgi:hypothetical protein